ncbi:ABC transporter ATP-binding protein [Shinella sumterensis]|uniref:ATP-binding cassette domain-containing protein n=1 Tax=Shinella sumterensis TaxID=1967501 RepID=UPI00106ED055|nr:ATP-binding cassette domain-containing protein [Shinella sumterensis]MCD1265401.1 ATP-binding cassette domain-containing protein [Shinella sumterensis]TFE93020.1 ABC transporter ATP-binding protein [Shinella sumterensis]
MSTNIPIIEARNVSKEFAGIAALQEVSLKVSAGEVLCLLGDNGAGKSTLIKILSGVHAPSSGEILLDGKPAAFREPRDARNAGIATVHQYGGTVPLMSISRNFFLGAEIVKGRWPLRRLDLQTMNRIALEQIQSLGVRRVTDSSRPVGTLSGGQRQALAICRATYFGARLLILDEPTSALGVREATTVLKLVAEVRSRGIGVILITHNAHHAMSIGDHFVVLGHGKVVASFSRGEKSAAEVVGLMAGGVELQALELELEQFKPKAVS